MFPFIVLFQFLAAFVRSDSYCYIDVANRVTAGVVTTGSWVIVTGIEQEYLQVYSQAHNTQCWLPTAAFQEPPFIHPEDLKNTLKWETLVRRWLPLFPDTLTAELVLSVVYKETAGNPHAVDQTGNDVRLVGYASVGLMGAIARPNLPCYRTLTSENGKDEYGCQLYLGMYILDWAIRRAHEIRTQDIEHGTPITLADVELGLQLYNCSEESVLAGTCASWGGETYSNLVLDVIMPEIQGALVMGLTRQQ
jgi:hypothetical protein